MNRFVTVLLAGILLPACATPEQRAARTDAMIAKAGAACEKLGFTPGTDAMANCKLQLLNSAQADATARAGVAAQNAANTREAMKLPQR